MPHPDTPELFIKLKKEVANNGSKKVIKQLGDRIHDRIIRKHQRINSRNNQIWFDHWARTIKSSPRQINTYLNQPEFLVLQKRDIEIEFFYLNSLSPNSSIDIYDLSMGNMKSFRIGKRMILENPFILNSVRPKQYIQSWSRYKSITKKQNKHLHKSGNTRGKQSRYLKNFDYQHHEYMVFQNGTGRFVNKDKIFLYGKFSYDVGVDENNKPTQFVLVDCARVPRKGKNNTGRYVELHSYPISRAEINKDLRGYPKSLINGIENPIY